MRKVILLLPVLLILLLTVTGFADDPVGPISGMWGSAGGVSAGNPPLKWKSYPVYANYNQGVLSDATTFTEAQLDSLATLDVEITMMDLYDPTKDGRVNYVHNIRTRNPDAVILDYIYVWGIADSWAAYNEDSFRRNLYDFVDTNNYWMYDYTDAGSYNDANRVAYFDPQFGLYLINFGAPGMADGFASMLADFINSSANSQPYTGVFLDFFDYSFFADWACPGGNCTALVDPNNNGVVYDSDANDLAVLQAGYITFVDNLRDYVDEDAFIIATNGQAGRADAYAPYTDGHMWEKILTNDDLLDINEWEEAIEQDASPLLSTERLVTPLFFIDEQGSAAAYEEYIITASLITLGQATLSSDAPIDGRRTWNPLRSEYGKINMGLPVENGVAWITDTVVYRQFTRGYVKVGNLPTWPWDYCLVDTVSSAQPDTIMVSAGWESVEIELVNVLYESQDFAAGGWSQYTDYDRTDNAIANPIDSTVDVDLYEILVGTANFGGPSTIPEPLTLNGSDVVFSAYVKEGPAGWNNRVQLQLYSATEGLDFRVNFVFSGDNLVYSSTEQDGVSNYGATALANGWTRIYGYVDLSPLGYGGAGGEDFVLRNRITTGNTGTTHLGENIYLWGYQVEEGVKVPSDYQHKSGGVVQVN